MNSKEIEILANLDSNSRITTKDLGKKLHTSQQSANYLLHKIEKESYFLKYKALIDPAKFGLSRIIVFYNYTNFKFKGKIIEHLKKIDSITSIEECSQGLDLMVEFTTPNLSNFNKQNKEILFHFKNALRQMEVYPVIVKHNFGRKYLNPKKVEIDQITCGDREIEIIENREKKFLKEISENVRKSVLNIAAGIESNPKTVIAIKKRLENRKIIRSYGISINTPKADIIRKHILINLEMEDPEGVKRLIGHLKLQKNIICIQKIIGRFELIVTIEKTDNTKDVLDEIRNEFSAKEFKVIVCENIVKESDIPISVLE